PKHLLRCYMAICGAETISMMRPAGLFFMIRPSITGTGRLSLHLRTYSVAFLRNFIRATRMNGRWIRAFPAGRIYTICTLCWCIQTYLAEVMGDAWRGLLADTAEQKLKEEGYECVCSGSTFKTLSLKLYSYNGNFRMLANCTLGEALGYL